LVTDHKGIGIYEQKEVKEIKMTMPAKILAVMLVAALSVGASRISRGTVNAPEAVSYAQANATLRFRLDPGQSKFIAHALRGGLLWFKGHEHLVAAREFSGEAQLNSGSLAASSLQLTVKTASMEETSDAFTAQQKQIINGELRDIVLEPAKYPEIVFTSRSVTGESPGANQYDLKLSGDLTLHGVTRPIVIPAKVTVTGNDLRAVGEFSIDRSDFKVKATSAVHGLIRVRNKVKFTFDIVGHRI
jgi:polyisoprenoid-binding protein YceI